MPADAQPILDMVVTDSKLDDAVRPTFLTFGGDVEAGEPFAHMIENRHLVDALVAKAKELGVDLRAGAVSGFEHAANAIDVQLAGGETISARLLVGADGARVENPRAGRHRHAWLELRPVGDRHDGRARARSQWPRRGAFSPRRSVRDLAADGKALVDRVDRDGARGRAHRRAARRRISRRTGETFRPASRRHRGDRAAPRLSARAVHRAHIHRRTAGADRRRRAHHPSDRRAGAQYGPARRRRFGGSGRRRGAARARYRRGRRAGALSALAALRHHDHGRRHRRLEPVVLQQLRRAAPRARPRPRRGRAHAGAQARVHPRGGGLYRRGAEAAAGARRFSSAEYCRRDRGTPCAWRSRRTSARNSASADGRAPVAGSDRP